MEKLHRLIANQKFLIDLDWGLSKLSEIETASEMGGLENMKEQTQSIDIFSKRGEYLGKYSNSNSAGIAHVRMSGVMTVEDGLCHYGMNSMEKTLRSLYANPDIKGILLSVNSGGGYATAGAVLYNAVKDKNKPLVVHTPFLASAAVMGTLAADEIVAMSDMSTIGSVGVMMTMPKWYVEYSAENELDIYSDKSPGKNKAWRMLKEGDVSEFKKELTSMDDQFMKLVQKHRPITGDDTLDGSTFNAREAKKRGLIDSVGTFNYAIGRLNKYIL